MESVRQMMFRGRLLVGIVLAVLVAGGLGLAVAQIFPSAPLAATTTVGNSTTSVVTSIATSTVTATAISTTTAASTAVSSATMVESSSSSVATSVSTETSVITTAETFTSSSTSVTACGTQFCGSLVSTSPSLWSENASSGYAALTFALVNEGNLNITNVSILFDGEPVGQVSGIGASQTVSYLIQLAPNFDVVPGQAYQVTISSTTQYGSGPSTEFSVTAQ